MTSTTLRFWAAKAGVVLAVFLLANGAAAVVGPGLSPPLEFNNTIAQAKYDQITDPDRPACVDILVGGASVASYGVDPDRLRADLGGATGAGPTAYNAALFGSLLEVETDWLERFVLPETDPALVLYVLPTAVFHSDSAGLAFNLAEWEQARATRTGLLADADRTAADLLPLYRYREQLTDMGQLLRWVTGRPAEDSLDLGEASLRPNGFTTKGGVWDPNSSRAPRDLVVLGRRFADWTMQADELDALRRFAGTQQDERSVAFVLPPMTEAYVSAHPQGRADIEDYRLQVTGLANELGIPLVDLSGLGLPDSDYADPIHLRLSGAQAFTDAVATELQQRGLASLRCTPAAPAE